MNKRSVTIYISKEVKEALEFLRVSRPGGYNLSQAVAHCITEAAKELGWVSQSGKGQNNPQQPCKG